MSTPAAPSRPLVIPETFDGTGTSDSQWEQWIYHFSSVAEVNDWDAANKLKWLKVRLTGRAQLTFRRLPRDTQADFDLAVKALEKRFAPTTHQSRYMAEFQTRRRKRNEGWAEYAESIRMLVDKAYPSLTDEAKECIALNHYLQHLDHPQIALSVKQTKPTKLDDALSATLEMESYLPKPSGTTVAAVNEREEDVTVAATSTQDKLVHVVEKLVERVEKLEAADKSTAGDQEQKSPKADDKHRRAYMRPALRKEGPNTRRIFQGACWSCGKRGHLARDCRARPAQNSTVSASQFNSSNGYRVIGRANGHTIPFLVDTGAGMTLLRESTWEQIQSQATPLKLWTGRQLVSVNGSPLQVRGQTQVDIVLSGVQFKVQTLVVSPLSTEAILGLDFLQQHGATVDLDKSRICLSEKHKHLILPMEKSGGNTAPSHSTVLVCMPDTVRVPPNSEIEVIAAVQGHMCAGPILLEEGKKRLPVAVARAVVEPRDGKVPVRLLNPRNETVVLHKNTEIATLEELGAPLLPGATIASVEFGNMSPEKLSILQYLVERDGSGLSTVEQEKFLVLLIEYADIFATSNMDLGRTGQLKHSITTDGATPLRQAVRRLPPARREEVRKLLKGMLEKDVIQQSASPWASPIVLVKKKDGSTRFCVDYRKLNELTRKDAYPLPNINATLDTLSGSMWFSTLDLLSGYWQVEVKQEDREKTAFCTTEGLYEFKVMPFGLCNAPATFQRLMDLVLAGLQWSHCLVYIDDVIVLGSSFEDHLHKLKAVFSRLREAGLKLKPSKCAFLQEEVKYLGHLISRNGVLPDPAKVEKVATWPTPTTSRQVQQFLGLANYYRRFVRDFATIAKPLHRLTERGVIFKWTEACQTSFEKLRQSLSTPPILVFPNFDKQFLLDTDASDYGIGAVLAQIDDEGRERVIAYGSRVLSKPERQYCVTRRELLAVVVFTSHFRPYLIGRKFTLRTDHGSITWLRNFKQPEGQLARWLEKLQELDFEVIHRRGKRHTNADTLSRRPCPQCGRSTHQESPCETAMAATVGFAGWSQEELRRFQEEDDTISPVLHAKDVDQMPEANDIKGFSQHTNRLFALWDQLTLEEGVLYRRYVPVDGRTDHLQLVVPKSLRKEILKELHEGAMGGHLGEEKLLNQVKLRFYWPGYFNDVKNWCRTCPTCAVSKTPPKKPRAALHSIQSGYPLQIVATDILGPLPESSAGNSYLLVAGDYFSRFMEAYPIHNMEAPTVARVLVDKFFCRFGIPEQLHSDQGKQFESDLLKEICRILRIHKSRTTPYHPQCDGLIERFNRTLISMLKTTTENHPFEWEDHVSKVCMAYNTSVQSTTGFSPFYLMFGREARLPIDLTFSPLKKTTTTTEYAQSLSESLNHAYELARQTVGTNQARQKETYNKKIHGQKHNAGDLVWLFNPQIPHGTNKKLYRPWSGPHKVLECISDQTYRIENINNKQKKVVHFNRLKPCDPDTRTMEQIQQTARQRGKQPRVSSSLRNHDVGRDIELLDPPEETEQRRDNVTTHRYPHRIRHPPDRLSPYVTH